MFEPVALERRVFDLNPSRGLHGPNDADLLCKEKTLCMYEATEVSSLLRGTRRRNHPTSCPPTKRTGLEIELTKNTVSVQMTLSRVIVEMVADGGGHFSPASYRWFTHMSLLFSSYSAHSRAEGSPIEHLSR